MWSETPKYLVGLVCYNIYLRAGWPPGWTATDDTFSSTVTTSGTVTCVFTLAGFSTLDGFSTLTSDLFFDIIIPYSCDVCNGALSPVIAFAGAFGIFTSAAISWTCEEPTAPGDTEPRVG